MDACRVSRIWAGWLFTSYNPQLNLKARDVEFFTQLADFPTLVVWLMLLFGAIIAWACGQQKAPERHGRACRIPFRDEE